jgi:hypothetical protein
MDIYQSFKFLPLGGDAGIGQAGLVAFSPIAALSIFLLHLHSFEMATVLCLFSCMIFSLVKGNFSVLFCVTGV